MNRLRIFTSELFIAFMLTLLLSGCSWMTNFIVTNSSDAPVNLSIAAETIKQQSGIITCPIDYWSYLETNKVPAGSSVSWQRLSQERYKLDQQSCSAHFEIFPGESVRISAELNYFESQHAKALLPGKINKLSIHTKDGEILITGIQIAKHFIMLDKSTYAYIIK